MYQKYVCRSPPKASHLLGTVLHPISVRQHDLNLFLQARSRAQESVGNKALEHHGWTGPNHEETLCRRMKYMSWKR